MTSTMEGLKKGEEAEAVRDVEKNEESPLLWKKKESEQLTSSNVPELRHTVAALLGPIADFYDFTGMAYVSSEIADAMFDYNSQQTRMLLVWTVFALGFVARGIGGFVFGRLGDVYGRARTLRWSLVLLAAGSLGIALLPTVQQIGVVATIGLVLFRILIGFTVACQYSEVSVMMSENSKHATESYHYRGSASSMISGIGTLLASATVEILRLTLNDSQMQSVGWRIPFLISSMFTLFVFVLQLDMPESVEFAEQSGMEGGNGDSTWGVLSKNVRSFWIIFFSTGGVNFSIYVIFSWIVEQVSGQVSSSLTIVTVSLIIYLFSAYFACTIADKKDISLDECRRLLITAYSVTSMVFATTLWLYVSHPNHKSLCFWILMLSTGIPLGMTGSLTMGFINNLVSDARERSTVVVSAYSCEVALFGGFAPLICQSMMASPLGYSGVISAFVGSHLISIISLMV